VKTQALLEQFVKSAARTTSKFHEKKTGNGPSVVHAVDFAEFNSAEIAVAKDLGHLLGSRPSSGQDIYSIHCADINGLSRLENNILVHEIYEFFGESNGFVS
jgi:dihydroxyacetone kinase